MKRLLTSILLLLVLFSVGGLAAQTKSLNILATTTIIADVARTIGGESVSITALIPPNADAHAFQPTPQDVLKVAQADVVLVNGIGYETFLGQLIENAGNPNIVVVSNGINILRFGEQTTEGEATPEADSTYVGILGVDIECAAADHDHGTCDPHVWTDPNNVMVWAQNIATAFAAADPAHADTYRANAADYVQQLQLLDSEVREILAVVPHERRVLVTNHEFMGYFAHAYGFEIVGTVIPGVSSAAEPDPQQLAGLIQLIKDRHVSAIFAEISANPQLAQVIADGAGIQVVTTLYSELLSAANGDAPTYLAYLRYNAQTIADALSQ